MTEIRIVQSAIEQSLSQLKNRTGALEADFSIQKGDNQLDLIIKIEEIGKLIEEVVENYRTLLLENEAETRKAVHTMRETDVRLAGSYGGVVHME